MTEALFGSPAAYERSTASTHATATSFSTVAMEPGQWWLSTSSGRVQRPIWLTYERWRNAPGSAPDGTGSRPRGSDPTTLSKRRRVEAQDVYQQIRLRSQALLNPRNCNSRTRKRSSRLICLRSDTPAFSSTWSGVFIPAMTVETALSCRANLNAA